MSRRQFLRDMRRDTRMRSTECYRSDNSSASTQNTSFTSQDPGYILEKPYQTSEGFTDPTDIFSGAYNSERVMTHDPGSTLTSLQCTLADTRCDDLSLRLPSTDIDDPHGTRRTSRREEEDLAKEHLSQNAGSHAKNSPTESLRPVFVPRCEEGMRQGESCLDSPLSRAEVGPGPAVPRVLQERLADSGLEQKIIDVKSGDGVSLKVATNISTESFNKAFSAAIRPTLDQACGIASLQAESYPNLRDFTPSSFSDPNLSIQGKYKHPWNDENKKVGSPIESSGNPLSLFPSSSRLVETSQDTLVNPSEANSGCKNQCSNASRIEASLLSIQVELANEKKRNIEAERLISSLKHEIEALRAENSVLSVAVASATSAGGGLRQGAATDTAASGRTPRTYIMELEQRISKITAVLETKKSEIEAKDERIRLLEHTLANRLLSTVVTPAAPHMNVTPPQQSIAHTATRGEVRAANIPDILSRIQPPGSAAVVLHAKASSLQDCNSFTGESKHLNKPYNILVSDRAGIEQLASVPRLPAPTLNLASKTSEKITHPTIDVTRHASKTTPQSMEGVELASSRNKAVDRSHIDSNKNKSDASIVNHHLVSPPPPHATVLSKRSESVGKVEASSVRGQEDAQLRSSSKQVRHPSVDLSKWRSRNSDCDSARASPRKPSVRRTPRRVSTNRTDILLGSSTTTDSVHRSLASGPRSSTATRSSFSHPYGMSMAAAPPLTASTTKAAIEHPLAGVSRQSSKPLCSMMRAWGRRGGKSPSPRGSPSLRSATSVNSRPRILFNEKDETTVMQGKTTTAVFRSSRTRQPTPLNNGVDKPREPLVAVGDRVSLIPHAEPKEVEKGDLMNK
ncbi:unnamed protein product [Phytomonas sp. EM1]|nr:unnamed protein product [Phytomonas sp. EM1]|eukprot:CCW65692.1 unnamed protein product [Phytomonas sp. isolate EM1]